jgi:sortase A
MRVPAAAGVVLLVCGAALLVPPLLEMSGVTSSAVSADAADEYEQLIAATADPALRKRDYSWDPLNPPAVEAVGYGDRIGVLIIPALGSDYRRVIAEGIGRDVLDRPEIGHFPASADPGEVGNFAIAGHRSTALRGVADVIPGDRLYVQTERGYYTYEVVTDHYIVKPSAMEVVAPVPGSVGEAATERVLTLVTCYGDWADSDRLILHAEFVEWRPLRAGPPAAIA